MTLKGKPDEIVSQCVWQNIVVNSKKGLLLVETTKKLPIVTARQKNNFSISDPVDGYIDLGRNYGHLIRESTKCRV